MQISTNIVNLGEVENEFLFILICPLYKCIRILYFENITVFVPLMFKLVQLLATHICKQLCHLAVYLCKAGKNPVNILPLLSLFT